MSTQTKGKGRNPGQHRFGGLFHADLAIVSPGAGVATSTVQTWYSCPFAMKIPLISVGCSAINEQSGDHQFNLALGSAAYSSGNATNASQTITMVVVLAATGIVINSVVNGQTIPYTTVGGDTTATAVAANMVTNFNNWTGIDPTTLLPFNRVYFASNAAGVITLTQVNPGATPSTVLNHSNGAGNATTLSTSVSTGGTNYTATVGGGTFAGGVNNTGITIAPNDNYDTTNVFQIAAAPQALFANDMGIGGGAMVPGKTANIYRPDSWDAIIPQGTILTLRVKTPATTGSISNLQITLACIPFDYKFTRPYDVVGGTGGAVFGHPYDPLFDIG